MPEPADLSLRRYQDAAVNVLRRHAGVDRVEQRAGSGGVAVEACGEVLQGQSSGRVVRA